MACKILVVGAGGIGCELLKLLFITNESDVTVLDYDLIEMTNLNRQFLFQTCDIRKSKARVAASLYRRIGNMDIRGIQDNIYNYGLSFFMQFSIVYNCLDNNEARSYVNKMCYLSKTVLIDGGSTGFLGQSIFFDFTRECFDCLPVKITKEFPVCTIHSIPTSFEHCLIWAKEYLVDQKLVLDTIAEYFTGQKLSKHNKWVSLYKRFVQKWAENRTGEIKQENKKITVKLMQELKKLALRKDAEVKNNDSLVLNVIYYGAVLRARHFDIEEKNKMESESIINKIMPSICTTNGCIASLMLLSYRTKLNYFLVKHQKVITKVEPSERSKRCQTCGVPTFLVGLKKNTTISEFLKFCAEYVGNVTGIFTKDELLYDESLASDTNGMLELDNNTFLGVRCGNTKYNFYVEKAYEDEENVYIKPL